MSDSSSLSSSTSASPSNNIPPPALERMIRKIISSPTAFFRNQQKNEPDLSQDEKRSICIDLYSKHPVQFLSRYYQYLDSEDVPCFRDSQHSISEDSKYDFDYYLQEMAKRKSAVVSDDHPDPIVKNRRYAALKKLIENGEYFSDYEMRDRDPLLFDQMVGQYQTEREQQAAFHSGDRQAAGFSSVLLNLFDAQELSKRRHIQRAQQAVSSNRSNRKRHYESDEEEEMDEEDENDEDEAASSDQAKIPSAEKQDLREDFVREMQERFLDGKDVNFDYRTVDENPEYDLVDLQARDNEDKYFDEEEPEESQDQNGDGHHVSSLKDSDA